MRIVPVEWRCSTCKKRTSKAATLDAGIADRLGEVLVAIGGVLDRLAGFEDRLRDKTDVGRTITLEGGVRVLKERILKVERLTERMRNFDKLESRISVLESKLSPGSGRRDERGEGDCRSGAGMEWKVDQDGVDSWEREERF